MLQPFEIRVESDIRFLTTVHYDWLTPGETTRGETFLAIVTEQEVNTHCRLLGLTLCTDALL